VYFLLFLNLTSFLNPRKGEIPSFPHCRLPCLMTSLFRISERKLMRTAGLWTEVLRRTSQIGGRGVPTRPWQCDIFCQIFRFWAVWDVCSMQWRATGSRFGLVSSSWHEIDCKASLLINGHRWWGYRTVELITHLCLEPRNFTHSWHDVVPKQRNSLTFS
jgi:hypothetical protein